MHVRVAPFICISVLVFAVEVATSSAKAQSPTGLEVDTLKGD